MPIRDLLPPVLRGEAAADVTPASRAHLEAMAHEAAVEKELAWLRNECAGRLKQAHAPRSVEYLLAAACALNGEVERAYQTLLALGEHLAGEGDWEPVVAVAERALALEETGAAARLLVRGHEGLKKDPERIAALERARQILPDDLELGLLFAIRLGEAGDGERRRLLLSELLPRFAESERWAGLEEAALEFVEHDSVEGLVRLLQQVPKVAEKDAVAEAKQLTDIAFPPVARAGRAGAVHAAIRRAAMLAAEKKGARSAEGFRAALVESVRQGPARELPNPEQVIAQSGLEDASKPALEALAAFDTVAALAPGRPVHHSSFGAGRIAANDGTTVTIDFGPSKGHRMPYAAALRTLTPIAPDDLRLLKAFEPAALEKLLAADPATVIVRALQASGGDADATRLKVFLVGSGLVSAGGWTAFWRKGRAAAEKDPRIDHARAFEQHYRLAPEGLAVETDVPLPAIEPRKPVKQNLGHMRKFLTQHPGSDRALAQRFGRYVERAMADPEGDLTDRARAGIHFGRWFPARREEWAEVLRELWEKGLAVTDLSTEAEQKELLEASHAAGVEADAILSALDSRFPAVRDEAERFRTHLDDRGRAQLRETLLRHSVRYPSAALRLIEDELAAPSPPQDAWKVLLSALQLVEEPKPKPALADKVLRWLEPGAAFEKLLGPRPPDEDWRLRVRVLLRQWRSSDRFLFPAMELADRIGLHEEVELVKRQRAQKTEKLFAGVGEMVEEADIPVMTRATWERLQVELERLQLELRTTIPAAIQKARELGDLRENAEFHSAKLKQANVSRLVASLGRRLQLAQFVEEMGHEDGIVGVGTEVTLESEDEVTAYWILGEGEQHHGDHVISFKTVVGRVLMGRSIGDEVELGEPERRRRYRIVSIERKLPPDPAGA